MIRIAVVLLSFVLVAPAFAQFDQFLKKGLDNLPSLGDSGLGDAKIGSGL